MFLDVWNDEDPATPFPLGKRIVPTSPGKDFVADVSAHRLALEELRRLRVWERVSAVFDRLIAAGEKRELKWFHLNPFGSASMQPVPEHWFDGETFEQWFYTCRVDPIQPHRKTTTPHDRGFHYLFVGGDDLQTLVKLASAAGDDGEREEPAIAEPAGDAVENLARELDRAGIPIRDVKAATIAQRWKPEDGKAPKREAVTVLMTGGKKGRPSHRKMSGD